MPFGQMFAKVTITSADGTTRPGEVADDIVLDRDKTGMMTVVGPLVPGDVITIEASGGSTATYDVIGEPVTTALVVETKPFCGTDPFGDRLLAAVDAPTDSVALPPSPPPAWVKSAAEQRRARLNGADA